MSRPVMLLSSLLIGLVLGTSSAPAAPMPVFRFDPKIITVDQTTQLIGIRGRIFNDLSADEGLVIEQISGFGGSGGPGGDVTPLLEAYSLTFGITDFILPVVLQPGESFGFKWGALTPKLVEVPVGIYGPAEASIKIGNLSFPNPIESKNLFVIHIVPEPSAVLLIGIGLTGLVLLRRRQT